MNLTIVLIGLVAALAAAVAAVGSWMAALKANATSTALAAIEADRRHDELTPQFDITCTLREGGKWAMLRVELTGGRLEKLDSVVVSIQDESDRNNDRAVNNLLRKLPNDITEDQLKLFVWGPWQFNAIMRNVDSTRESKPLGFSRVSGKNWQDYILIHTKPGSWMTSSATDWRQRYEKQPLRLLLTCRRNGYPEAWLVQRDVPVKSDH